ncbi:MAG: molybdopterin molybdotransferase MoeA [Gemmataceae bacterium]|nr:molybdopterin molybdotransferase MoeA [Gemmataceae bacterium]
MLSVADALARILAECRPLAAQDTPLSHACLGLVLAEGIRADLDSPPFDKALMDGYAVRSSDAMPEREVIEEVFAGQAPARRVGPGQAVRIMTGAPMPEGADAVVPVEKTTSAGDRVRIPEAEPGMFVHRRGAEYAAGEELIRTGTVLRPQELGVLAAVGRTRARLVPAPRVAVLATGDELVEPPVVPGPGQIRNSNAPLLLALAARAGAVPVPLPRAADDAGRLGALIREGLAQADALVLAGGVSAGKADLVPGVLASLGMRAHFHQVAMKPGKPLLFGTAEGKPVFGLPGNPVSAFVTFELFVRPALRTLAGRTDLLLPQSDLLLEAPLKHRTDRPTYHPARLSQEGLVRPVAWKASADLAALLRANAFIVLPAGESDLPAGTYVPTLALDA